MNNNSFLGINGYIHWNGVVEATNDPLKLGRCRVRIFGWHNDNKQEIPTDHLPWANLVLPVNGSKTFSTPLEGDYVVGYFADGKNAQIPLVTGVIPGYVSKAFNMTQGFAPDNKTNPVKTDRPAGRAKTTEIGQSTITKIAQGIVKGSAAANTNINLDHACDFKFQIDFNIGTGTLLNPTLALQQAIKGGKNRAAAAMRLIVAQINEGLRLVTTALIASLGLDPSGQFSFQYSMTKNIFRKLNEKIKEVAQIVEDISFVYNMVLEIQQIIDYLNSLPDRIKKVIEECILRFMNSINNIGAQLKAIPGQVGDNLDGLLNSLTLSANDSVASLQELHNTQLDSAGETLYTIINSPDTDHSEITSTYLTATFANTETTLANAKSNEFDITQNLPP
jgi:hypothetical protein